MVRLRPSAHYRLYQQNPERYRDLTRSVFLRLEPFMDLYARVELPQGDEVSIDLLLKAPMTGEEAPEEEE